MQKILLIDNYDSFTFNLLHYVQYFENVIVDVFRNDEISLKEIKIYDAIILSPGPGLPSKAGIMMDVIKTYASSKKILGVCLGMQGIVEAYGGQLKNLNSSLHGVKRKTIVLDNGDLLFNNFQTEFYCGRYHSWVANRESFPECLIATASDESGEIMALKHKAFKVYGVQFHPESILTEHGLQLIENWIAV